MPYDVTPNTQFTVQTTFVGKERQPVLVVDNYLRDPESMIRYAVDHAGQFQPAPSTYPGLIARTPKPYLQSLIQGLFPHLARTFGVNVARPELISNFYGIVTLRPEELHPGQRIPHVDSCEPGQLAILHYLCDGSQGGTAFFRHRATGYEAVDAQKFGEALELNLQDLATNGPCPPEYITTENRLFEQIAAFEARFNRLLVYRSRVFHSGLIGPETRLDPNPRIGRLTTNTFIRFPLA
jgi:hypothetical protein